MQRPGARIVAKEVVPVAGDHFVAGQQHGQDKTHTVRREQYRPLAAPRRHLRDEVIERGRQKENEEITDPDQHARNVGIFRLEQQGPCALPCKCRRAHQKEWRGQPRHALCDEYVKAEHHEQRRHKGSRNGVHVAQCVGKRWSIPALFIAEYAKGPIPSSRGPADSGHSAIAQTSACSNPRRPIRFGSSNRKRRPSPGWFAA